MTKVKYKRPMSPAEIALRTEVRRLEMQGEVRVVANAAHQIVAAQRLDVFDTFLSRKAISQEQHNAVRRLEADMAGAEGVGRDTTPRMRVDSEGGLDATDRKLMATDRIAAVIGLLTKRDWKILLGILMPQFAGGMVDWRDTVLKTTGERDKDVQAYVLRAACGQLVAAYVEIDNARRPKCA